MRNQNFNRFEFQSTRMPKTPEGKKLFAIVGFILLGLFLVGWLTFFFIFRVVSNGAKQYESTFTTLTGIFETTDSVRAPVSGKMANVVEIRVNWTCWSAGSKEYNSDFSFLYFKPGTLLNVNGKKYKITGDQVHYFRGKKDYGTIRRLKMQSLVSGTHDTVPNTLVGLDKKLDEHIQRFRSGHFIMGANCRFSISEQCYSTSDTVTIRAQVRNDTIFLDTSKY